MNALPHEALIRLVFFAGILLVMSLWELGAPRRHATTHTTPRWFSNLGLAALNSLVARFVVPLGVTGVALLAEENGWGLLRHVGWPGWVRVLVAVVALDFVLYIQHVLFHAVPLLWRLHLVHHADQDCDVTTGVRFHPLETLLSLGIKTAAVLFLGAPALSVLIFEVLLNATSMFNHANVRLPAWLDCLLRLVIVTPDMHRVHHSADARETNANFGFNLPWWDMLLGTYRSQPALGHERMTIGLAQLRDERTTERLPGMLLLPFHGSEDATSASPAS